jgi:ABC-2 type transport system ATP-binding protein
VHVRSPQAERLGELLAGPDVSVVPVEASTVEIRGLCSEQVGTIAAEHGIVLYELTAQRASLEEAFMELTHDSLEFHTNNMDSNPKAALT